jgi:hypothetical protein
MIEFICLLICIVGQIGIQRKAIYSKLCKTLRGYSNDEDVVSDLTRRGKPRPLFLLPQIICLLCLPNTYTQELACISICFLGPHAASFS